MITVPIRTLGFRHCNCEFNLWDGWYKMSVKSVNSTKEKQKKKQDIPRYRQWNKNNLD